MTKAISLFTIGFTKKTAEEFFTKLRDAKVARVLDVRLNNNSQLAGFAKRENLPYFLRVIADIDYVHIPELAPTQEMLTKYKKQKGGWAAYEKEFLGLIEERKIQGSQRKELFHWGCLLCSEHEPDECHRRLVAEYLGRHWGNVEVTHL